MPHNSHSSQNASATGSAANSNNSTNLSSNGATSANTTAPNSASGAGAGGSSSPGDDLGSADEVKVFKDEGEQDEEISSQNLLEEKSSLIDLTESEVNIFCNPIMYLAKINFSSTRTKRLNRNNHRDN